MIDTKQLRIGNIVNCNGIPTVVEVIWKHGINLDSTSGEAGSFSIPEFYSEQITAIPLSPDILVKCGFEWDENKNWFRKHSCYIFPDTVGFYIINDEFHTHIDTFHHLQNYWYFNTGEELNIDL